MKAEIFPSDEVCMYGTELRRLRIAANMSERALARKMGWYRKKVERYENSCRFCLDQAEMDKLLDVLSG